MLPFGNRLAILSIPCLLAIGFSSPAVAGDKPFPKAPAPQNSNLQACPEYGRGFVKIPGSDICTRASGSVRGETGFGSGPGRRSDIDWRTQGTFGLDARDSATGARAVMRVKGVTGR